MNVRHGNFKGKAYSRTVAGFRGVNQGTADTYRYDEQRVRQAANVDFHSLTIDSRQSTTPRLAMSGRVHGGYETSDMQVVAAGNKIDIQHTFSRVAHLFIYLTDEDGVFLTDEDGNKLTE